MCAEARAFYLYCFAPSRPLREWPGSGEGIDGCHPVFLQPFPAATAVLSEVPVAEFCGPQADLGDLSWVGPRACRHERIVEQLMAHSPVLPARFGTLFSSPATLQQFVERNGSTISRFLDRVADHEEWAVKGLQDRTKVRKFMLSRMMTAQGASQSAPSVGKRYLEEQRIRGKADQAGRTWVRRTCQILAVDLQSYASSFVDRISPSQSAQDGTETIFNWAFLLPRNEVAGFRSQVQQANERCAAAGLNFTLSGPWPPYSFVPSLELETAQ